MAKTMAADRKPTMVISAALRPRHPWVVRNTKINVRPGTTAVVRTMPFRVDPAVLQAHVDKPLGSWTRVVLSRVNIKA